MSPHPPTATEDPTEAPLPAGTSDMRDTVVPLSPLSPDPAPSASHSPNEEQNVDVYADEVQRLRTEVESLRARASQGGDDIVDLDDERVLQEVGIYNYHHPLENAEQYRSRLGAINNRIKEMVKAGDAILASDKFSYNNSLAMGRKITADFSKLMLRAYNAEADNCVRVLRAGNIVTAKRRLDRSVQSIAKLGSMMEMRVNPRYHELRFEELELTSDPIRCTRAVFRRRCRRTGAGATQRICCGTSQPSQHTPRVLLRHPLRGQGSTSGETRCPLRIHRKPRSDTVSPEPQVLAKRRTGLQHVSLTESASLDNARRGSWLRLSIA